jgi:hypothetical protein
MMFGQVPFPLFTAGFSVDVGCESAYCKCDVEVWKIDLIYVTKV